MARHGALGHLQADELSAHALGANLLERLAACEFALGGLDDPGEPRLERVRGLVDVVAVERVFHLEPQRVARAEPNRGGAVAAALRQERGPELLGLVGGSIELEAVLTRVAGARDQRRHLRDGAALEPVVTDLGDVAIGEPANQRLGLRPLHRDEPGALGRVTPARILHLAGLLGDPRPVLFDVPRVHREQIVRVAYAVDGQIVDDRPVRIAEERVVDLAHLQGRHVVGGQTLERRERARALHLEFAHVAHVEETDGGAHRPVLFDDAGVLHRHLPAPERHHARAGLDVRLVERRALERGCAQAFGSQSRSGFTWQPARSSASRTARTMFCAPGVSPWQQMVCTEISISTPSIVRTLLSMAIFTAWAAAFCGSVIKDPGSLRDTSVRSTL